MAPKKSIPSKNLTSRRGFSSSSSPSILDSVRFHDEKAKQDFYDNFSDWAIHSERQIILSNFLDTPLPSVLSYRGWASLGEIPKGVPVCSFRSSSVTCMPSLPLCLGLLWYSKVHVL